MVNMTSRRLPLVALALSGLLWGTSAPLTKVALGTFGPGWLTAVRFVLAGLPLLWLARHRLRAAATVPIALWGAAGYGVVVALWNAGLARTSVTHGALLVAGVPALVALVSLGLGRGAAGPRAWVGYTVALAGVALVASDGGNASLSGDLLVLASMVVSAVFTVAQADLLVDRDPVAVTAVQFAASAVVTVPLAAATEGAPWSAAGAVTGATGATGAAGAVGPGIAGALAVLALIVTGTLLPFTLFAWAQARTPPEVAGAFLNLEPIVGAGAGALAFGDPFGPLQYLGAVAVLGGIGLSALPAGRSITAVAAALWHRLGTSALRLRVRLAPL
jgi:drug/metabolite transporter (DMT)-like permease